MQCLMKSVQKTPNCIRNFYKIWRHYIKVPQTSKEFIVAPFCNINVYIPFNVHLRTLDVHNYADCDRVIIHVEPHSHMGTSQVQLNCVQNADTISIFTNEEHQPANTTCFIKAPIKANLSIATTHGHITLSNFNGDYITLKTVSGNITVEKCHCNRINITSNEGNIVCKSVIQAAQIFLKTSKLGSISAGRLQGIDLAVETESGNITTESTYCNSSKFTTTNGHLVLQNTHKNCKINVQNEGSLDMIGFDGSLDAILNKSTAKIQFSRIESNSKIFIKDEGSLQLKLFESCQQNTTLRLCAADLIVDPNMQLSSKMINNEVILKPNNSSDCNVTLTINCTKSAVQVQSASWADMFNLSKNK